MDQAEVSNNLYWEERYFFQQTTDIYQTGNGGNVVNEKKNTYNYLSLFPKFGYLCLVVLELLVNCRLLLYQPLLVSRCLLMFILTLRIVWRSRRCGQVGGRGGRD